MESFAYTTIVQHLDWDLAYLGDHLAVQIAEWHAELQANQPPAEERPAMPLPLVTELQEVPPPPPKGLSMQVIKGDLSLRLGWRKVMGPLSKSITLMVS